MVRFLGVAFMLLFSFSAMVAAGTMPRVIVVTANDVGSKLLERASGCCEPYDIQLDQPSYSPYAQRRAAIRAARQAPSVAPESLAVHVRACFNSRSLTILLTTDLIQAVKRREDVRTSTVKARAIKQLSQSDNTVGVRSVESRQIFHVVSRKPVLFFGEFMSCLHICAALRTAILIHAPEVECAIPPSHALQQVSDSSTNVQRSHERFCLVLECSQYGI